MKGHIMDMGFFDECLDISEETEDGDIIKGRFCNLGLAVPLTLDNTTETDNLPLNVSDKVNDYLFRSRMLLFFCNNCCW